MSWRRKLPVSNRAEGGGSAVTHPMERWTYLNELREKMAGK
ncbi:hypothetical protein NST04_25400 [Paenibacillus sp. FSL H7-0756]